ncbi:hypothetical protein EST38_g3210 [Candolleomyces aberdarensis]|uniref:Uncharacterized protein n=1 Tax=Candolleomyces aberdarensis TaxID=2316362 RepID=A0A4V1Q4M8_9AGAR|nr:hypothetical protein EST38_g3210 [Candolleomyces aberdarensis]
MATEPIPDDVIIHIVQYLEDDIKTLKSCALVSRSIHKYAYKAIFSTLDLNALKNTSLGTSQIVRVQRVFIFFEFKPYLKYSVQSLRISATACSVFNTTSKDVEPTVTLWHVVPKLLSELPNLVELDLNTGCVMLSGLAVKGISAPYPVNVDVYRSRLETFSLQGGIRVLLFDSSWNGEGSVTQVPHGT